MKEYFFLKGKEQIGPLTIEQLEDKGLNNETFVWTEGMENWMKLKDLPELAQILNPKSVPPPPPSYTDEISKTEVSGKLKITTEKAPDPIIEAIKPKKNALTLLIIWVVFHLFALLMSYSEVKIFNDQGNPQSKNFWPFVEFYTKYFESPPLFSNQQGVWKDKFHGFFAQYDWTEFAFYVGGVILIYILASISNKYEEKKTT